MKKLSIISLALILGLAVQLVRSQGIPDGCQFSHWSDPNCEGTWTPVGNPYFSCSTGNHYLGEYYCCKYSVQNYSCQFPPPATAKFFTATGYEHTGRCESNEYGQWCPSMPEPGPPD